MLKLHLLDRKNSNGNANKRFFRANPDPLETPVLENIPPEQQPEPRSAPSQGQIINRNHVRAVCTLDSAHPFTSNSFQRRSRTAVVAPQETQEDVDEKALSFFQAALTGY